MLDRDRIEVRRFAPTDDIGAVTAMLHRAYARLGAMGLNFTAVDQNDDTTRERLASGEGYLAFLDGALAGTVMFRPPGTSRGTPWYVRPEVAVFGQFGVEPTLQGAGLGAYLMDFVEARAHACGAAEIALDTAEPAAHLRRWYTSRGYRFIEYVQWKTTNYRSVILSKSLVPTAVGPR